MMSTSKKELVVKSNQVIEASYQLSSTEQRIVLAAISKLVGLKILQMMKFIA
jgi:hypothetical protein